MTGLVCLPAGLGLTALAEPIAGLLYGQGGSAPIVAGVLRTLGPAAVFAAVSTPLSSMLQAVGRAGLPVKLLAVAMTLKLGVNWFLCGVPQVNIQGAGVGTLVCYSFLAASQLIALGRVTGVRLRPGRLFGKPLGCALLCACAAWAAHRGLTQLGLGSGASAGAAIGAGGLVYAASLLASRALAKKDLLMLPGGEKIAKTLEKRGWM